MGSWFKRTSMTMFLSMQYICFMNVYVQEVEAQIMAGLKRPTALSRVGKSFVNADVQCPKKPRGRKKKSNEKPEQVSAPRPSAAACGFSTEGMSDQEVWKKLQDTYGTTPANEGMEKPSGTNKRKKNAAKDVVSTAVDNTETKKHKKAKVEVEHHDVAKASRASASSREKLDVKPKEPSRASASWHETPDIKPKKSKRKRGPSKQAPAKEPSSSAPAPKRKAKKLSEDEIQQQEAQRAAAAKQAAKARVSRKSSAYHKAALAAKKNGASKEEQVAAGKAVS